MDGQFTLWNLGQQTSGVLGQHSVFEDMQETRIAGTCIKVYQHVGHHFSHQVPSKVFPLASIGRQVELVWHVAGYKFCQLVIHSNQVLPYCPPVVIAIGELLHVLIVGISTHVEKRLKPVSWHQFCKGIVCTEKNQRSVFYLQIVTIAYCQMRGCQYFLVRELQPCM